jgi:UDP-GlcNAc:undecaprenyl-phosphate/decaprenyl-phosphate GlcNAc-1-phosphate transferase
MNGTTVSLLKNIAALALGLLAAQAFAQEPTVLKTQKDKDSYAIGADLARNLKRRGVSMETEPLLRGMRDVLSGGQLLMAEDDLQETLRAIQNEARQKTIMARKGKAIVADETGEKGAAFLALNKTNQGVICLPSGLQYKVLKAGDGPKPTATDSIECRFRGTLIDGRDFAGTGPSGPPVTFKMSDVMPGWKEALLLMPVGSKWQLFIPPQLAFGQQGAGRTRIAPRIEPNATLIYDLELVGIK